MAARKVGTCDGYSWRQTYDEFTFITPLPKGASAKTVHVDVKNRYLKVQIEERIIVQGALLGSVDVDGCAWSINDGNVELILEKSSSDWWTGLIQNEIYVAPKPKAKSEVKEAKSASKSASKTVISKKRKTVISKKSKAKTCTDTSGKNTARTIEKAPGESNISPNLKLKSTITSTSKLGQKGHGELNEKGNEGEDINHILVKEKECKNMFETLRKSVGLEHHMTLTAAFNLMDQWIGNYRLTLIDNLLMGKEIALMKICRRLGGQWKLKAVQMLAFCRWKQFRYKESLDLFYEFQDLAGKSAILLENMGHTHNSLGETDKAEECFLEALDRIERGDRGNKGGLLMGIGIVRKSRGDLKGSAEILLEALAFYKDSYKGVDHSIVAKSHTSVGRALEDLGEIKQAEHHFYEAVRIFWLTCGISPLTGNATKRLGDLKVKLGFMNQAQQLYHQALDMHVNFDTMDLRAILDILTVIPMLHITERCRVMLAKPDFDQYLPCITTLKKRIESEGLTVDGTLAVLLKAAAEIAIPGGRKGASMAIPMLEKAIKFFNTTAEADCSRLITQSKQMIEVAQKKLS
ncbi:hypothetical protein AAMO2058_000969100 [Amorphochlora amoebiformis]